MSKNLTGLTHVLSIYAKLWGVEGGSLLRFLLDIIVKRSQNFTLLKSKGDAIDHDWKQIFFFF